MIYLIADTHFGDEDIIKVCSRPFETVKDNDMTIIHNWNDIIKEDDTVYLLGDVGKSDELIKRLKGEKYLVKGNHDKYPNEHYIDAGFKWVYDCPIVIDDYYILSHKPLDYISPDGAFVNIFGHVHNSSHIRTIGKRSYCVSAERINYKPISFAIIKEKIIDCDYVTENVISKPI